MKKAIFALGILLSGATGFGQANTLMKGLNFVAPTVNGKANVYSPATGEIIFDSSDSQFYGNDGMSNWLPLSGSSGANTTLSNLTGTTAINQNLYPDSTTNNRDLGDFGHMWGVFYGQAIVIKKPSVTGTQMGSFGNAIDLPSGSETDIPAIRALYDDGTTPASASVAVYTWSDTFFGGNTGHMYLETGNTASGNSGNILMRTGTAGATRGYIGMDALYVKAPQGTSDPSAPAGSVYYNTSTNKLRLYDGSSWVSLN